MPEIIDGCSHWKLKRILQNSIGTSVFDTLLSKPKLMSIYKRLRSSSPTYSLVRFDLVFCHLNILFRIDRCKPRIVRGPHYPRTV